MLSLAATLLSLSAAVLTALCFGPQLYRAYAVTTGVSTSAWLQSFALGLTWATYGLYTQQWVLLASEGVFALGSLAIVSRLLPLRHATSWTALSVLTVGVAFTVFGPGPCLLVASVASVTVRLAQIHDLVRAGTGAGVSAATWTIWTVSNVAWTAAGICRADAFFAWSAGLGALSSSAVVAVCLWANQLGSAEKVRLR